MWHDANFQNTSASEHFWKITWWKSAGYCGAKHISKSKCTKHTILRPLLEVEILKKVQAVVAQSTFPSQKCRTLKGTEHFWTFRCRFAWQVQGIAHLAKSEQNVEILSSFNYNHHYTILPYTILPSTALHSITLHRTTTKSTATATLHYTN